MREHKKRTKERKQARPRPTTSQETTVAKTLTKRKKKKEKYYYYMPKAIKKRETSFDFGNQGF
jgi:hypothetical protein